MPCFVEDAAGRWRISVLKAVLAAVAWTVGLLAAAGVAVAVMFELDGFGGERDTPVRADYLTALAVALLASLAIPALLTYWATPHRGRRTVAVIGVTLVGCGMAVFAGVLLLS